MGGGETSRPGEGGLGRVADPPTLPSPYAGEPLLNDQSFLRRLPVALNVKQRMEYDAIVTAADIITVAFSTLRQITAQAAVEMEAFDQGFRAMALSLCWTIIDQLHAIRQLLQPGHGEKIGPLTAAFLDAAEPATKLRNRMDHLSANLDNISKSKGSKRPLFGSLSYCFARDSESAAIGANVVTIMSGALHGSEMLPFINPSGRTFTLPTGLFTLSAFDCELELGLPIGALRDLLVRMESLMETDIRAQLERDAKTPDEVEKGMASTGGGLAMVMDIRWTKADGDELEEERSGPPV